MLRPRRFDASLRSRSLLTVVSDDDATKPPMLVLLESLEFYRNVRMGLVAGALLAATLYLVRTLELLGPLAEVREYPVLGAETWFLLLAFVFAATFALLVAAGLTVVEAARGAKEVSAGRDG